MEVPEFQTHAFILKVWVEETAEEAGEVVWRGHITHVPSGSRKYIGDLDDMVLFVQPYLKEMGVDTI